MAMFGSRIAGSDPTTIRGDGSVMELGGFSPLAAGAGRHIPTSTIFTAAPVCMRPTIFMEIRTSMEQRDFMETRTFMARPDFMETTGRSRDMDLAVGFTRRLSLLKLQRFTRRPLLPFVLRQLPPF